MNSKIVGAALGLIGIGLLVYVVWHVAISGSTAERGNPSDKPVMCTLDAMQCPDGSWVGRSGPNCEFMCPHGQLSPSSPVTVSLKLNERATPIAESITLLQVIEDSRCPQDVECIQAGTVRVRTRLESGMGTATETFTLGNTITTETEAFTFVAVSPATQSGRVLAPGDYRFVFTVVRR